MMPITMSEPNLTRAICRRIKDLRMARKLSQSALAERVGVSQGTISRWEESRRPDAVDMYRIARALEVPIHELYAYVDTGEVDPSPPSPLSRDALRALRDLLDEQLRGGEP